MQSSHAAAKVSARFDDPNLVGYGGLEPVVRLAERCGLPALASEHVRLPVSKDGTGAFPAAKLMSLVGGMVAGADSIDDMDRLRHGALGRLFAGVRAPSTLGSFLRSFTHGHVKQLHAVARRFLPELAAHTGLLSGAESVAHVDIDDTIRRTYGYAKQGAGYGYSKVKGLNALLGIVSTPLSAPVIAATRLRKGPTNSARGAAAFVAETIRTARASGATGLLIVRADSAFYGADVIGACRALDARFSVTVRMNASIKAAIAGIDEAAWKAVKYPKAVWDEEGQCWISDAEIAEATYTAFTSKPKNQQVTARLIVRRVKRLNPGAIPEGQGTLFDTWRYHGAFTNSPLSLAAAERDHRRHAVVEQVIADVKNGPFAHAPSGHFQANAAWLALSALAHNLTRAAGTLASAFHAKATTGTIRDHLINVPARLARSARRLTLHLPQRWPWRDDFTQLFDLAHAPPPAVDKP
ncbi:IS1380 family transposase [Streptomyces sp. NBC_01446]|uniref:IS1380 family transposase n=1 Tax=Streptomyces sp. NBC_00119 TaxID=2975659 RepID=A0AAU1U0B1_9ACTN|nr:IS1380 family transposase [Streptomyces sp. NBC_01446]MCX4647484.1 IS1380 family transposase [Streptomyces sp. NBC_01446]